MRGRHEIERLLQRIEGMQRRIDGLMAGLSTVASALNANDPCLARIAAVHLRIPDLPNKAMRGRIEAEDALIKYGGGDWNPALHPRTGTPPNPGWFAPADGVANPSSPTRVAQNDDSTRRSDADQSPQPKIDGWGRPETLDKHLSEHGGDFGVDTPEDYVTLSQKFFNDALADPNSQVRVHMDQKIVRIYDPATNTFGAYNLDDHTTRTFFKPTSESYWARNAHAWGKNPSDMTSQERRAFMARTRGTLRGWGDEE